MKTIKKITALVVMVTILVNTLYTSAYATENGKLTSYYGDGNQVSAWDGKTTEFEYYYDDYTVSFILESYWDTGYNLKVRIKNISEYDIHNWYLAYDSSYPILKIWNAEIYEQNNNYTIIKNAEWNQDISAGGIIEYGITCVGDFFGFPSEAQLVTKSVEKDSSKYDVKYIVNSDWNTGFSGTITIINKDDKPLEDWTLEFNFGKEISNLWNGKMEASGDGHYVVQNVGYNSNIPAGGEISFGFVGKNGARDICPTDLKLYTYEVSTIEYVQLEDGSIDKKYLEEAIKPQLILDNKSIDNIKLSDDYDNDGLTLIQEYEYDTNPFIKDTDGDRLNDYDEVNIYFTNPIDYDTDDDNMGDGIEIECGLNPLLKDTDGDGDLDNNEIITQQVKLDAVNSYTLSEVGTLPLLELTGVGDFSQQIYAEPIKYNETILDINCLVGTAYDFIHDEDFVFESGKLSFVIDDDILQDYDIEDLAIAWYNDENNSLELLETFCDNKTSMIWSEVNHFSKYMVVSSSEYFYNLDRTSIDSILKSGKADIVFAIDTTGSMSYPISNVYNNIDKFVSILSENNVDVRLGLIEYRDIFVDGYDSTKCYNWYTDVAKFKSKLKSLQINGGGDAPETAVDALKSANDMEYRTGVGKYIILVTDAGYKNGTTENVYATLSSEVNRAKTKGITVSIVTNTMYFDEYKYATEQTDGILANINQQFSYSFIPIIDKIGIDANSGCWVRLSNGFTVKLEKDPNLGDDTIDTDKDGIPDVVELGTKLTIRPFNKETGKKEEISTWTFYSNPVKADTDGDGILDVDDLRPKDFDVTIIENNEENIEFNTGNIWYNIPYTAEDYMCTFMEYATGAAEIILTDEDFDDCTTLIGKNSKQKFNIDELVVISILNNEGAKFYLDEESSKTRETIFKTLTERESKYYQRQGVLWWAEWKEVSKGAEKGFFKGTVYSEADLNLSLKIYKKIDFRDILDAALKVGAVVFTFMIAAEVLPIVVANTQALVYYVKTFGVVQGIQMYKYLGIENLPNGVISWLQMDMADGDSSLDDLVDKGIPIYKRGQTGEEYLKKNFPGESQQYFETYVDGVKYGRYVDMYSDGIAYEAKVGYTCLSKRIKLQVLKDAYLIEQNKVDKVVWVFFRSEITGKLGASRQLIELLNAYNIEFLFID